MSCLKIPSNNFVLKYFKVDNRKHLKPVISLGSADCSPKSQLIKNGEFIERVAATKYISYGSCQNYRSSAGLVHQMTLVTPVKVDTAQLDRAADF